MYDRIFDFCNGFCRSTNLQQSEKKKLVWIFVPRHFLFIYKIRRVQQGLPTEIRLH